ncbi:MAG: aldehyde dehydrogenase [Xanthomonadales bacterium]|nr:aldehyde dehydrogenase [Xanthomonadales bacterium]
MSEHKNHAYWSERARQVDFPADAIINGAPTGSVSGRRFDCLSPVDGSPLCQVSRCNHDDVDLAVTAARTAFDSGTWSSASPQHRKRVLLKFADLVERNAEDLALMETLDMGKPISDSVTEDVPATVNCLAWHAEAIDKVYGEVAATGQDELGMISREPLGVVAAIVPWNYPMLMAAWKLGPALATGNSVILKPSEKSPLTAIRLGQLALEAGLPPGVLNVLPGFGHEAGEPLAADMDVDGLVFTGSTAVARHLLSVGAMTNMKRCFMECGGKSPNLVFADAPDLQEAANASAAAIFSNQGEVCTAASRLLVHESIQDEFLEAVVAAAARWQPGHPLDPQTSLGAMVDETQAERVLDYIEEGSRAGARLRCGGSRAEVVDNGWYIEPTVFDGVSPDMSIAREEIFGPVLSCMSFSSDDEAVQLANDTDYGLAAGLWTRDLSRAHQVARRLRAGSVWVNYYDGGDMTAPFGGYKQSGNGRDKSLHALEKYTELKATWINLG